MASRRPASVTTSRSAPALQRPSKEQVAPGAGSKANRLVRAAAVTPVFQPMPRSVKPSVPVEGAPADTKTRILDAAFRCLATQGYAALSIREIGKEAGVNSALINYHFGTKDQLVIEVLDAANERLLARQRAMYAAPQGFAEKWAQALRFYESDLASGFVRVQAELMAAGYSNPWLRDKVAARVRAWADLIHDSMREAFDAMASQGIALPKPLTPEVVANWMSHYWLGLEVGDLLGGWLPPRSNAVALEAIQHLLQALDERVAQGDAVAHHSLDARAGTRVAKKATGKGKRNEPAAPGELPKGRGPVARAGRAAR